MSSGDQSMGRTRPHAACWPLWEASHCRGSNWSTRLLTMPPRKASGIYMPTNARLLRPDVIDRSPMIEQEHFKHYEANDTFIHRQDWPKVDELIDWLIQKNESGYKMVNSVKRLQDMKDFRRGKVEPWNCRAGQNSLIIRVDGTLAPCFPMYSATHDWGTIEKHKFEVPQLDEMKKSCQTHCFSTLNHNLGFLQRCEGHQLGSEAGCPWIPRRNRQLCVIGSCAVLEARTSYRMLFGRPARERNRSSLLPARGSSSLT